ncbi:hypothetical protein GCM10009416_48720 [Craurococcus roseus]|uniref:SMI1/KNR4 family protein n=1 Tax=Craurococcus roseus TaxID=77585 RepID=A0ABN1G7A8_9PROT
MPDRLDWGPGYTSADLDDAQAKWGLRFPPDLVEMLLERRPILSGGRGMIDWVHTDEAVIEERLQWPFEGFLFDVERNGLWWPEWGERPAKREERRELLQAEFSKAPKLVPIHSHRYLPSEPFESGNPVFSVHQSDVIHYGSDLADYFDREALGWGSKPWPTRIKRIPFWTVAVERNG